MQSINDLNQYLNECMLYGQRVDFTLAALHVGKIASEIAYFYVELPTDDNGEPIRPCDVLTLKHNGNVITVRSIELVDGEWHIWPQEDGGPFTSETPCTHRVPTVREMLTEFATALLDQNDAMPNSVERLTEEYANKIRKVTMQ